MKKIRELLRKLNLLGRLAVLESFAIVSSQAFAQVQSCINCGAVVVTTHPKVLKTAIPEEPDKIEIRCPWCARDYERSPLAEQRRVAQRKLDRAAPAQTKHKNLRAVPDDEEASA